MALSISSALATALAASIALAAPAGAAEPEARAIAVGYGDIDLASEDGKRVLRGRLDQAARQVCGLARRAEGAPAVSSESIGCYRKARHSAGRQFAALVSGRAGAHD